MVAVELTGHFLGLGKAEGVGMDLAGLDMGGITLHLTISLSRVKQNSHQGCFSFISAFYTNFPITSFYSISYTNNLAERTIGMFSFYNYRACRALSCTKFCSSDPIALLVASYCSASRD